MANDVTTNQPGDAGADQNQNADTGTPKSDAPTGDAPVATPEPTAAPAAPASAEASTAAPATAIAPDGVFVEGVGLVEHPDLPAPKNFLQALEAEVLAAEKAGKHKAHAALNDIHLLLTQVKAKAKDALEHLEDDAAEMVRYLHGGL